MAPSSLIAIAICLGLLGLMVAASRWAARLTPEDYVGRGLNAHAQGRYEPALAEFDRAIEINPKLPEAFFNRAQTLAKLDRLDAAIRDLNTVIALRRDFPDAYNQRAALYARQDKHALAAADYGESIRQTNYDDQAYLGRAAAYRALGRIEDALADYGRALELNPLDPAIYLNRARLFMLAGKPDHALADFDAAFARGLVDPEAARERDLALVKLGQRAEDDGEHRVVMHVGHPQLSPAGRAALYRKRSAARLAEGELEAALADCEQALALSGDASLYLERAEILRQLKRYDEALADCARALALAPTSQGYLTRGVIFSDMERYEQAIADHTQALAWDPSNAWAYNNRGFALACQNRYQEALPDYEQAARLGLRDVRLFINSAMAHERLGDLAAAFGAIEQAIEVEPKNQFAYAYRGRLGAMLRRSANEWRTDFAKALTIDSKNPLVFNAAAWYLALDGVPAKALALAEQALALEDDPAFRDTRGLALALGGEIERAVPDFSAYADHLRQQDDPQSLAKLAQREGWLAALRAGENPFTPEVLDELRRG